MFFFENFYRMLRIVLFYLRYAENLNGFAVRFTVATSRKPQIEDPMIFNPLYASHPTYPKIVHPSFPFD
jgi:hypothetical protein